MANYLNSLRVRDWIILFVLSAFVAACGVLGVSYVVGEGYPALDVPSEVALIVLFTVLFAIVFMLADAGLVKLSSLKPAQPDALGYEKYKWLSIVTPSWNIKSIAIFCIIMAICWLPWFIANLPGSTYWDTYYQIYQVYPENHPIAIIPWAEIYNQTLTDAWLVDHHPILTTLIYGAFGWSSDQLTGNWMAGVFLFCLIQTIAHIIAFTVSVAYLRKIGCPRGLVLAAYAFLCLMPFVSTWAMCMVKDSMFGLFFIPYLMLIFEALRTRGRSLQRTRNIVLLTLCALMLCLTKKTGIFVVIPTALLMGHVLFYMQPKKVANAPAHSVNFVANAASSQPDTPTSSAPTRARMVWGSFAPAIASILITCILFPLALFPALNIEPGGKQEVLGPLFQQTARYVYAHGDEVTPEEEEAIAKVLDYDKLAENYQFDFEDSVKYRYNLEATNQDIADYLATYFAQGLKHPDSYFGAFMGLAGFYVAPTAFANIRMVTVDTKMGNDNRYMLWNPDELDWLRNGLDDAYEAVATIPGINIPLLIVTYALWIPAALLFFVLRRRVQAMTLFVPFAILLAFCIIAPVYDARYVVPIFDGIPLLVCCVVVLAKKLTIERS